MGGERPLVDLEATSAVVSNAGGIRTPLLAGHREDGEDLCLLLAAQLAAIVQNSKETAHTHTSASAGTGSLTKVFVP